MVTCSIILMSGGAYAQQNLGGGQAVRVTHVKWNGFHSPSIDAFESSIQPSILGQTLSDSDLARLQVDLTTKLRAEGYLISQVIVTADDRNLFAKTGELNLTVFPGKVGSILIKNTSHVDSDWIYEVAKNSLCPEGLGDACVLTKVKFERMTQLLQDTTGLQIDVVDLDPNGAQIGQTKITITTLPKDGRFKGTVGIDNQGFSSTGKYRLGIGASGNNLFGVGDVYSLDLFDTNKGSVTGAVTVSGPLNTDGLRWQSTISRSQFYVPEVNSSGFGNSASVGISHPVVRGLDVNWVAGLNAVGVITNSETLGYNVTNKTLKSGQLTLDGNSGDRSILLGQSSWYVHSALTAGTVSDIAATTNMANALGSYTKFAFQGVGKLVLSDEHSIYSTLNIRGQAANKNLDPYEKLLIGGYTGVRAYSPEQGSFNGGTITTVDLRKAINTEWGQFTPSVFVDYANGWINHATWQDWQGNSGYTNSSLSNHMVLSDVGLGVDWNGFYGFTMSASWAKRLPLSPAAINNTGNANSQFWFLVQSRF